MNVRIVKKPEPEKITVGPTGETSEAEAGGNVKIAKIVEEEPVNLKKPEPKPAEEPKPAAESKPAEEVKPAEEAKPAEEPKPEETKPEE
jgi:hypothetical protein